jgi:hypothetical protein
MTLRAFLIVPAVVYAIIGLGFLFAPETAMGPYAITLDANGVIMSRIAGAAFIGLAIMFWYARDAETAPMSPALKGVLYGGCTANVLALLGALRVVLRGQVSPGGWLIVAVHAVLAAGFLYYADFSRRAAAT